MTTFIELTQGQCALIDDEDYEYLNQWKWQALYDPNIDNYYVVRTTRIGSKRTAERMHRIVLERMLGHELAKGEMCDHINHNTLDNRRENLRLVTNAQNKMNSYKYCNNTSGYKGVYWHKHNQKWCAQINVNNKKICLGYFDDPLEAAKVYDQAALYYFVGYASLNFGEE